MHREDESEKVLVDIEAVSPRDSPTSTTLLATDMDLEVKASKKKGRKRPVITSKEEARKIPAEKGEGILWSVEEISPKANKNNK